MQQACRSASSANFSRAHVIWAWPEAVSRCLTPMCVLQGFPSKVRDAEEGLQDSAESVQERKQQELQRSLWDLGLAWGLVLICCTHHLGHWLHGLGWHGKALSALHPSVCHVFHFKQAHSGPGPCAASGQSHGLGWHGTHQ